QSTEALTKDMGTDEQWAYALTLLQEQGDWVNAINYEIGLYSNLELFINASQDYTDAKKWLYFIALKRFGAKNECLDLASQKAQAYEELVHWIVRGLVDIDCKSPDFWKLYDCRKALLNQVEVPDDEVLDYCRYIKCKKREALYYLTDSHRLEKEFILECIADYSGSFSYDELRSVLQHIYPDLYAYLMPYKFNAALLNQYFEDYKFCKLENRITPEFYSLVEEQAVKREYNLILPARSEKIESIDMSGAFAYFMDAMGVEFLGYISEKSKQKKLLPKITVCRSELPSITSRNKDFLDVFAEYNVQCKDIKQIDDIKHHGAENFTLENSPYPTHLIRELEIIDHVLDLIKLDLAKGKYTKAILVSDHGASRLVVLKNQLIDGEFDAKGTHCGRVCAYTEQTGSMPMIVQAGENDEYAVVANYERFKPGRLMGVEVHGGATLEEVTVPIIELSYVPGDIEIIVQTPLVMSSIRKPPIIEFYSTTKIDDIVVNVGNTEYKANTTDGHTFSIEMSKRTRANTYTADVYAGGTMIATGLEFRVEKEGFKSNDIL
ncbi:MAG: BREX-4 system phosphatase PglZ, partial [Agathobacter sp.]